MNLVFDPTKTMDENIKALREVAKKLDNRLASLNKEFPTTGQETYWFPASVSPVHKGLYQKLFEVQSKKAVRWAWWDNGWFYSHSSKEWALRNSLRERTGEIQGFAWRGCKEQK